MSVPDDKTEHMITSAFSACQSVVELCTDVKGQRYGTQGYHFLSTASSADNEDEDDGSDDGIKVTIPSQIQNVPW